MTSQRSKRASLSLLFLYFLLLASAGWATQGQQVIRIKDKSGKEVCFYKESYALVIDRPLSRVWQMSEKWRGHLAWLFAKSRRIALLIDISVPQRSMPPQGGSFAEVKKTTLYKLGKLFSISAKTL